MSDELWLRERLAEAVPEPPGNPDRARASVDRARQARRRTAVAVAVGACLAVAAVVTVPWLAGDDESSPRPADLPSVSPTEAPACPPAPRLLDLDDLRGDRLRGRPVEEPDLGPIDLPDPDASGGVREGATSVRLCQGPGAVAFDVPTDALVTDVDRMVDVVNGLPEISGDLGSCVPDPGLGYRLSFGYSDGSTFVVSGRLYDCRTVVVGSTERLDADAPWEAMISALRAQRSALQPPALPDGAVDGLPCPPRDPAPVSPLVGPAEMTAAVLCLEPEQGQPSQMSIPADDLATLMADLTDGHGPMRLRSCRDDSALTIVGLTEWGDHVLLPAYCGVFHLGGDSGWQPGRDAQRIISRLAASASS